MFASTHLIGFGVSTLNPTGVQENTSSSILGYQAGLAGITLLDLTWEADNGKTVYRMGTYANSACTIIFKIAQRTGAGAYTMLLSESKSHTGSGLEWFNVTPTPITTSEVYAGYYTTGTGMGYINTVSRALKSGDQTGSTTGWTENSINQTLWIGVEY